MSIATEMDYPRERQSGVPRNRFDRRQARRDMRQLQRGIEPEAHKCPIDGLSD